MAPPGFTGKRATPGPHADLTGYRFPVDTGGLGTVTGPAPWSPAYVLVDTEAGPTARVAAQLRIHKEAADVR